MDTGTFTNGVVVQNSSRYRTLCRPGFHDAATVADQRDNNIGPQFHIMIGGTSSWIVPFSPLLCTVPYFYKYVTPGQFRGSRNILVGMPTDNPNIFAIFYNWLFYGIDVIRLSHVDPEDWIDFILMAERFELRGLARDATIALIDVIQLYPPLSKFGLWCMEKLERCYIRTSQIETGTGLRFVMVHFLAIYFRYTTRNKSSQALLNTRFESDSFRWGPIINIQPNYCSAQEALSEARHTLVRHSLPLIFKGRGFELNSEIALLMWEERLETEDEARSQQLQAIADKVRGYLNIVPFE